MSETSGKVEAAPSGVVTFLFTDIEGSTALWEQHPEAMRSTLTWHDGLLRLAVESSAGRVIKNTGDGLYAVFEAPVHAVQACLAVQRALLVANASRSEVPEIAGDSIPIPVRVRMGLHTGEAEHRDGDYFGASLNRAARIMSAAHGGQVLLSAQTAELVAGQ
jgi:class 3 adenylate cyclase